MKYEWEADNPHLPGKQLLQRWW